MDYGKINKLSNEYLDRMIYHRRKIHSFAETGFDTTQTASYIEDILKQLGLTPRRACKNGIYAHIEGQGSKSILLRCDIDALPVKEETKLEFSSKNGCMHACGHDMHAAMLLGCAEILCSNKSDLKGRVTLLFQPAEELLQGAESVIKSNELNLTQYGAAVTLHVISPCEKQTGTLILPKGGVDAPSADFFKVTVKGKGCHGSSPWLGHDPVSCICNIITSLDMLKAREVSAYSPFTLNVASINAGSGFNVIPNEAHFAGSLRCFDENVRCYVKDRMADIIHSISKAYRCETELEYTSGCPPLKIEKKLCDRFEDVLKNAIGADKVFRETEASPNTIKGSEDFSYFSQIIPSFTAAVPAGFAGDKMYSAQMHSPRVLFDENSLSVGCCVFTACAMDFLER